MLDIKFTMLHHEAACFTSEMYTTRKRCCDMQKNKLFNEQAVVQTNTMRLNKEVVKQVSHTGTTVQCCCPGNSSCYGSLKKTKCLSTHVQL